MSFANAALSSPMNRAFSVGPIKCEIRAISAASGDTSGTVTAACLHTIYCAEVTGLQLNAQPTFSGATATLAFNDPVATVAGQIKLWGV